MASVSFEMATGTHRHVGDLRQLGFQKSGLFLIEPHSEQEDCQHSWRIRGLHIVDGICMYCEQKEELAFISDFF